MLNLEKAIYFEDRILKFCKDHTKVFLYGAGTYGKIFFNYLNNKKIEIVGFITSDGGSDLFGKKVYKASEIREVLDENCGIILSVNESLQNSILKSNNFNCDIYKISNVDCFYIESINYFKDEYFYCEKNRDIDQGILVIQLEVTFGDMIWSTAFLRELKHSFPNVPIDYIMNEKFIELYKNCPYIRRIYGYDCSTLNEIVSDSLVDKVNNYIKEKLNKCYSVVFLPRLLPLSSSDAWENILLAVRLGEKNIFGHALYILEDQKYRCEILEPLFTSIYKHDEMFHEAINDLKMLDLLGIKVNDFRMELWPSPSMYSYDKENIRICIALVGSVQSRSWKAENYGKLINEVKAMTDKVEFVLCGGADAEKSANIVQNMTNGFCENLVNKTTLSEVVDIISTCDIYIGSDTGLMHVASSFNKYIIELSASNLTSPAYWGSSSTRTGPLADYQVVLQPLKGLDECKYMCLKTFPHCINQIKVAVVYEELMNAIGEVKVLKS